MSGTSANVDMLVGDIYGGDCDSIGLKHDVIAYAPPPAEIREKK